MILKVSFIVWISIEMDIKKNNQYNNLLSYNLHYFQIEMINL